MTDRASTGHPRLTHYAILGVSPDADARSISAAYRGLARRFHPDRNGSASARELMLIINQSYEALKHPERRAAYDRSLHKAPPSTPVIEADGPIRRRAAAHRSVDRQAPARVLDFGRYAGRTIGEVATLDPQYLEWLVRTPAGRGFAREVQAALG